MANKTNKKSPGSRYRETPIWTETYKISHLLQFKREYDILIEKYGCSVQETCTVQDPPTPLSDTLQLSPLNYLHKTIVHIQELPHPGDSRRVLSPSQHTLSRQIMRNFKDWEVWKTNIEKSNRDNHRMIQQLVLHTQRTIQTTSTQDLDPRPCADNVHVSV